MTLVLKNDTLTLRVVDASDMLIENLERYAPYEIVSVKKETEMILFEVGESPVRVFTKIKESLSGLQFVLNDDNEELRFFITDDFRKMLKVSNYLRQLGCEISSRKGDTYQIKVPKNKTCLEIIDRLKNQKLI